MAELDAELVLQLAASLKYSAVGWFVAAAVLFVVAVLMMVSAHKTDNDDWMVAGWIAGCLLIIVALVMFGCHLDDYMDPRYEAAKKIHNGNLSRQMWPE